MRNKDEIVCTQWDMGVGVELGVGEPSYLKVFSRLAIRILRAGNRGKSQRFDSARCLLLKTLRLRLLGWPILFAAERASVWIGHGSVHAHNNETTRVAATAATSRRP